MKIIAVGDVHGRSFWKEVAKKEKDFDRFIFVGDYFDNWPPMTPEQIVQNFAEILSFKKAHGKKVVLCMGNHDFQYTPTAGSEKSSGYNKKTQALLDDMGVAWWHEMFAAHLELDILFSHAGVSQEWLNKHLITFKEGERIDEALTKYMWLYPQVFAYNMADSSGYGEHPAQSPFWIRPNSLVENVELTERPGLRQVVGHTFVEKIVALGEKLILIDAPKAREYLKIEDGVISVEDLD